MARAEDVLQRGGDVSGILAAAKGGSYLAAGNLFEFASRMVIALLLARTIGAHGHGLYTLAISAATVFAAVAVLGLDDAMVRYVAIMKRRGDGPGLWGTVRVGVGISVLVGVVLGGALYVAAGPIAAKMFDEPELARLLRLLSFVVPVLVLSDMLLGCARGFGRMDHVTIAENIVQSVVRMGLLAVLAVVGLDVVAAIVVFALADLAAAITLVVLLTPQLPRPPWRRQPVRYEVGTLMRFALPMWISGLIAQFNRNIQAVFLGALATVASVGVYTIVTRVNLIGHILYRSVISAVKPILAGLHDQGDREGMQRLYTASSRWTLAANVPFFLVMVLYPAPILAIFGDTFTNGAQALVVLAFAELALASTGICGSILDMTGHTRVKLVNSVFAIVVLVVANAMMIPRWGLMGAALAALVATVLVEFLRVGEVWLLERVHPYGPGSWKPYVAGAVAVALGFGLRWVWPIETELRLVIVQAGAVVACYVGTLLALGVEDDDRMVWDRVLAKLLRRRRRTLADARVVSRGS